MQKKHPKECICQQFFPDDQRLHFSARIVTGDPIKRNKPMAASARSEFVVMRGDPINL